MSTNEPDTTLKSNRRLALNHATVVSQYSHYSLPRYGYAWSLVTKLFTHRYKYGIPERRDVQLKIKQSNTTVEATVLDKQDSSDVDLLHVSQTEYLESI